MKSLLLLFFCAMSIQLSAQTTNPRDLVADLEKFMDSHIPEMHMSVNGYTLTYSNGILKKTTLIDEGEPHSKTFDMKDAVITADKLKLDPEEAKMYGYKTYYEININGDWIIDGLPGKKDAQYVVKLLESIVETTK